ncbi:aconitate hydratase [Blattabacterium cuenoti]|uniref:aconitate hydratase n=1 Tax=Blattabacterium cuenoti TaxID=1653831 RepID=UPI00163C1948|nr:aconitate hydratase [Blattabacterium cuenoti]
MIFNFEKIKKFYSEFKYKIDKVKSIINRPMTYSEKILYAHIDIKKINQLELFDHKKNKNSYMNFYPDRLAMQDATAQMAILQFMQTKKNQVSIPTTIHCDHLIYAQYGKKKDLINSKKENKEIYDFLKSTSNKYKMGFWEPGSGIIHQVVLENHAFPGGMIVGTDSHTPNSGGLGMLGIGIGGAEASEIMSGYFLEINIPKLIGVVLKGKISGWTSPKDIILKLSGIIGVMGGSNSIIEYIGNGTENISCAGKATICNMGAELGATSSLFPYDFNMKNYLINNDRKYISTIINNNNIHNYLKPDVEVYNNPNNFYDKVINIDLSVLEPYINGPFTPDKATPISKMKKEIKKNNWPNKLEIGLVGSCTNSSSEDLLKVLDIINQAKEKRLKIKSKYIISPGSNKVYSLLEKNGFIDSFKEFGAEIFSNACGPCIGQWKRNDIKNNKKNTIIHSFNRNFSSRNDGNPKTYAFIASPEIVTSLVLSGRIDFDPRKDSLINEIGEKIKLKEPKIIENIKKYKLSLKELGYKYPLRNNKNISIKINKNSKRLQILSPYSSWNENDFFNVKLLIKVKGKCTTDHISTAGPWLKYRGHIENISNNLLIKAINYFNNKTNKIKNFVTGNYDTVPNTAKYYKINNIMSVIVGEENYGEGSSREHAAMEPRYFKVCVVLVKSFSRIHETNLKKQGILALTFLNVSDYYKIEENDTFNFYIKDLFPNKNLFVDVIHNNKKKEKILVKHSYNDKQIQWFKCGSSLNFIQKNKI